MNNFYLKEETEEAQAMRENIINLLKSKEIENIMLGFQLIDSGGYHNDFDNVLDTIMKGAMETSFILRDCYKRVKHLLYVFRQFGCSINVANKSEDVSEAYLMRYFTRTKFALDRQWSAFVYVYGDLDIETKQCEIVCEFGVDIPFGYSNLPPRSDYKTSYTTVFTGTFTEFYQSLYDSMKHHINLVICCDTMLIRLGIEQAISAIGTPDECLVKLVGR